MRFALGLVDPQYLAHSWQSLRWYVLRTGLNIEIEHALFKSDKQQDPGLKPS